MSRARRTADQAEATARAQRHAQALAEDPTDQEAHLGHIQALEDLTRWPDAAAAIGLARLRRPELDPALRPRHVAALHRARRLSEAVLVQQEIAETCPDDLPAWIRLGQLLLEARSFGAAAEAYGQALRRAPAGSAPQAKALLGRLNALGRARDWAQVLAETSGAQDIRAPERLRVMRHRARALRVMRHRARALRELGQLEAAAAVLTQSLADMRAGQGPGKGSEEEAEDIARELQLNLGQLYVAQGDLQAAAATFDALLAQAPSHGPARLGRADVATRQGAPAQAMAILEAALLPGLDGAPPRPPRRAVDRQRVITRYVTLAVQADGMARLEAAVPALEPSLKRLSEADLAALLRLVEPAAPPRLTRALLSRLMACAWLTVKTAVYLVELALRSAGPAAAQALEQRLAARLAEDQRRLFRAEAALLQDGPEAALRAARAPAPDGRPRSPVEAAQLGHLLLETGAVWQAMRYLRAAAHHWRKDRPLKERLFHTYLRAGAYAAAEALLPAFGAPGTQERRAKHLKLLFNAGRLAEAEAALAEMGVSAEALLPPHHAIRLYLALGRLAEAEALIPEVVRRGKASSTSKFMVSQSGAMINEQRLWERFDQARAGAGTSEASAGDYAFYYPAKCVVDAWVAQQPAPPPELPPELPPEPPQHSRPRVMQYWNTPEPPPAIAKLMATWRDAPDLDQTRLDRRAALAFLKAQLGEEARAAFRLANNVAEECDYLRLAWLYVQGGIYVDADDKRIGPVARLLRAGGDVILFRENVGSLANNVMIARPGHPLIGAALRMAQASLLARENDNTWAKTGPGLITRAAAGYIEGPHQGAGLTILPLSAMHVAIWPHAKLPHKASAGHWNTPHSSASPVMGRLVQDVLQSDSDTRIAVAPQ